MRLMMDVTEYVELPGILPTLHAFTEALYLAKGVYGTNPVEWRVPRSVFRNLLRDRTGHGPAVTLDSYSQYRIVGVPINVTHEEEHVRLVFKKETLESGRG